MHIYLPSRKKTSKEQIDSRRQVFIFLLNNDLSYVCDFGWFWVVLAGCGSFWLVLAGFGWFWLVLAGFGSFWLVPRFSKYVFTG